MIAKYLDILSYKGLNIKPKQTIDKLVN